MKALLVIMAFSFSVSPFCLLPVDGTIVHRLIVLPESTLEIDGSTNVNTYRCSINKYAGRDTLVLREGGKNVKPVFEKGSVQLDASSFDCGMALMTSDFHKAVNSKQFPSIIIKFISFERAPAFTGTADKFKGIMTISLGGVSRTFELDCFIQVNDGVIHLAGGRDFLFSDFNLIPPTRMLGAVRVNESLKVNFRLKLRLDPG